MERVDKRATENQALGSAMWKSLGNLAPAVLMKRMRRQNLTGVGLREK